MLKQDKNLILETLKSSGAVSLDQIEVIIENEKDSQTKELVDTFLIKIKNTPLQFGISQEPNVFWGVYRIAFSLYAPGYPLSDGSIVRMKIDEVCKSLTSWLNSTVDEYFIEQNTPDLWEQLEQYQPFISSSTFSQDDFQTFAPEEKSQIINSLDEFRKLMYSNFNPNEEQEKFINERLEYLKKAVDRLNRFDWRGLAISIVVGIGINLSLDTNSGKLLLDFLRQAFNTVQYLLK